MIFYSQNIFAFNCFEDQLLSYSFSIQRKNIQYYWSLKDTTIKDQILPLDCTDARRKLSEKMMKDWVSELQSTTNAEEYFHLRSLLYEQNNEFQIKELRKSLQNLDPIKLHQYQEVFLRSLTSTPWKEWSEVKFQLQEWNTEWKKEIGNETPAGVRMDMKEIGLDTYSLTNPLERDVFLFHEIAHIMNDQSGITDSFANELITWIETMKYIEYLKSKKILLTPKLNAILSESKELGIETWVQSRNRN